MGRRVLVFFQKPVDAADQASEAVLVDGLAASEVMEDERLRTLGLGIPVVVGELDVLGDRAVLVFAFLTEKSPLDLLHGPEAYLRLSNVGQ
jgi:hypothetical protein